MLLDLCLKEGIAVEEEVVAEEAAAVAEAAETGTGSAPILGNFFCLLYLYDLLCNIRVDIC